MKRWRVYLTPGDVGEVLEADAYRLGEGGSLVLWSGSIFEPVLVRAYAPTAWHAVQPDVCGFPHPISGARCVLPHHPATVLHSIDPAPEETS